MSDELRPIAKSTAQAICDAVKAKEGTTDLIPVNTLADRISALPSGVNKLPQIMNGTVTEITAEDLAGATKIKSYAFAYCSNLNKITIPSSIIEIEGFVFQNDSKLESAYYDGDIALWCNMSLSNQSGSPIACAKNFYIRNSVTNEYELINANLVIPHTATKINTYTFAYCSRLTSVTIPDSVTSIGYNAFAYCDNLNSVTIGSNVASIGNNAFYGCKNLTNITIPDSVISIGQNVFYNSGLVNINVGNGLTNINSNAFANIYSLTNFTISSSITTNISFKSSANLTIDSLKNIINALADYYGTDDDGKYTLTLNSACNATLEAEGATAPDGLTWREYAQFKGWNLV